MIGALKASCPTDSSYASAATAQGAMAAKVLYIEIGIRVAIALANRQVSKKIAEAQDALANRQVQMAEQIQAHAIKFWPAESAFVADMFNLQKEVEDYIGVEFLWEQFTSKATRVDLNKFRELLGERNLVYSLCDLNTFKAHSGSVKSDLMSRAARQEESVVAVKNDSRYEKQVSALSLGKGVLRDFADAQAAGAYSTMSAASIYAGALQGGLGTASYMAHRRSQPGWGQGARAALSQGAVAPPGIQSNTAPSEPVFNYTDTNRNIFGSLYGGN